MSFDYVFYWSILYAVGLQQQYNSIWSFLLFFIDSKVIVCVHQQYCTLWNISISHCEPWLFIHMNWDSPWYLVLVAEGTIMYDAYSTPTCTHWAVKYQRSSVFPVLLCLPVSFERCGLWCTHVPDNCSSSFTGEAVSIGTLVDKLILSTQSW